MTRIFGSLNRRPKMTAVYSRVDCFSISFVERHVEDGRVLEEGAPHFPFGSSRIGLENEGSLSGSKKNRYIGPFRHV
jgi:hypothetical protein